LAISILYDKRVQCLSALTEISVGTYLQLADRAYENRGGIDHQRGALKTASGRRIRERMVKDIVGGAVLPPIVIGVVAPESTIDKLGSSDESKFIAYLESEHQDHISIIDGMQRTTALLEAVELDRNVNEQTLRLEIWYAHTVESLIYRMLILNSGQVPWNLKQQLRVVYEPLVEELYQKVDFSRLLEPGERRWKGGEFSSDDLIETYIAFGLRRTEVDTQENLAEEFSKLDISESLSENRYSTYFFPIVQMMVDVDRVFSKFEPPFELHSPEIKKRGRLYERGKNIFDTQPPRIGFIVANALQIFGRIGMNRDDAIVEKEFHNLTEHHARFVAQIDEMPNDQLGEFLALDVLQEALGARPTSAVGRWERAFWERAFKVLLEESFQVPSMIPCWRAG
jgi:hypothetical protein